MNRNEIAGNIASSVLRPDIHHERAGPASRRPLKVLAVLRRDIKHEFFQASPAAHASQALAPREVILSLRDQRVLLDADLARLYGVETRALNQAMKRNQDRFPADFMFDLAREEILRISQTVTSLRRLRFSKQVRAFTEHGALMAAMVLSSPRAVAMSVYVIRAFIQMREEQAANAAILKRLTEIDKTLLTHDAALWDIYQKLLPLLTPPPDPPRKEIGFHIKEQAVPYRVKRHASRS